MKPDQQKSILFVVEQTVINGKDQFGNSNDLFFISQALRDGYEVYVISPEELAGQNSTKIKALKLGAIDSGRIDLLTQEVLHQQSLNYFLARPANLPDQFRD